MRKGKKVEERIDEFKILCERCGSNFGYVRIKTHEWVCRRCQNIQKLKEIEEE